MFGSVVRSMQTETRKGTDMTNDHAKRIEELRVELRAERISLLELCELQELVEYIDKNDVEILEAAGVDEQERVRS